MASNYSILVDTKLNVASLKQQLASQKLTLNVDDTNAKKLVETGREIGLTYQQANVIFHMCVDSLSSMVDEVYELDHALTEFKKVSTLRGSALDTFVSSLSEAGSSVARTTSQMVEAATQFKRAGFEDEDLVRLSKVSTMLQNVSDKELEVGEATDFVISQMKAFNFGVEDTMHIIDAVNEV